MKCIALFQKIHGVDTLLFALYVYEYDQHCSAPNRRRVYISYLDSVQYFQPKCYRTTVYQAVLVEYLRYVKERGFHTAHIWSCPPTPGDDYIFYCHPSHQRMPREDMLRSWYHKLLEKAKTEGIVLRTSTLYDEYFSNDSVDSIFGQRDNAACLPYFEGDYIPGELENIIRKLKKLGVKPSASEEPQDEVMKRVGHNLKKMKDNFIVVHLRSRRFAAAVERGEDVSGWIDDSGEELVRSKRAIISGKDSNVLLSDEKMEVDETLDASTPLMVKSEKTVADLNQELSVPHNESTEVNGIGAAEKNEVTVVPDSETLILQVDESKHEEENHMDLPSTMSFADRQRDGVFENEALDANQAVQSDYVDSNCASESTARLGDSNSDLGVKTEKELVPPGHSDHVESKPTNRSAAPVGHTTAEFAVTTDDDTAKAGQSDQTNANNALVQITQDDPKNSIISIERPVLKRSFDEVGPVISKHVSNLHVMPKRVWDTSDIDPAMESEMFESRQQFLNYCQTNHCQFDELRRAKHSTMMVLFQLHNPLAPKFLQQCVACYRDIANGIRYHCNVCSNFDLCDECYHIVTKGELTKQDARFTHDKSHTFTPFDMEAGEETQNGRVDRQKALQAHVELLEHSGTCQGQPACSLQNCQRMKKLFDHVQSCDVKPKKDCKICSRLLSLCAVHARLCNASGHCPIPFCDRIRERNQRLRKQQQLMDDRRRQAQNELYHTGSDSN